MHPFLRNKAHLLVYLCLWLPVDAVFTWLLLRQQPPWPVRDAVFFTLVLAALMAFIFLAMYPVCRALPLNSVPLARIVLGHTATVTAVAALWIGAAWTLAAFLDRGGANGIYTATIEHNLAPIAVFAYIGLSLAVAQSYLLLALEQQREAEKNQQQMHTLAREAELRSLRSQINPHFLFNSLNSISALTTVNPERAREMCLLLAEFFRRNIDLGNQDTTTLGDELDLVFSYLQIEMARFGKRLQIDIDVPDNLRSYPLPPLLLQPLVENAVKHGISGLVDGGVIAIRARSLAGGGLSLQVENPFDPDQPRRRRRGIGLENLRGRLDFRYGNDARFELTREAQRYRAKIQIAGRGPAQTPRTVPSEAASP